MTMEERRVGLQTNRLRGWIRLTVLLEELIEVILTSILAIQLVALDL